jgi:FtsH-binding integral membrane protein
MSYGYEYKVAGRAEASERATFIRRTYAHLAVAILLFVGLEGLLLQLPNLDQVMPALFATRFSWLLVLVAFVAVSWVAERWARSDTSRAVQYAGLSLYVVAEAVIFLPLLWIADRFFSEQHVIATAGIFTLAIFGGLTLTVFITQQDFSFLRPILTVGSCLAIGLIVAATLFNFSLGLFFCFAMVALASGCIIYQTSNIMLRYRTDQYVAAALALFAAVALLFWYILQITMMRSRR